ncbi:MAG: PspC domain-containing protein [Ignavibacteria bacterium]|nr:PspC domain-containing protein [Ignavibacteria bacterium]
MPKRLYLSRKNKVIAGVAGGIAEYLDVDPVLIRIAFIIAVFAGGSGILAYIIAWIIIPEQPKEETMTTPIETPAPPQPPPEPKPEPRPGRGSVVGGAILIVLGLLFLGHNFLPDFHFIDYWPLILVVIGAGLIYRSLQPKK